VSEREPQHVSSKANAFGVPYPLVERIDRLRTAVAKVRARHPFEPVGWVVLPDHMHAVWSLPPGDTDFATRWGLIKADFSRGLPRQEPVVASRVARGERGVWQRRYWEHRIRDADDLRAHLDYLHFNPVKYGHAPRAADWPYSSIHGYIRRGELAADWAAAPALERLPGKAFGE
jgi:putative transposase